MKALWFAIILAMASSAVANTVSYLPGFTWDWQVDFGEPPSGRIKRKHTGDIYDSPSGAAGAIKRRATNGWTFWRYLNDAHEWVPLAALRGWIRGERERRRAGWAGVGEPTGRSRWALGWIGRVSPGRRSRSAAFGSRPPGESPAGGRPGARPDAQSLPPPPGRAGAPLPQVLSPVEGPFSLTARPHRRKYVISIGIPDVGGVVHPSRKLHALCGI
jgi:hypothetical protein